LALRNSLQDDLDEAIAITDEAIATTQQAHQKKTQLTPRWQQASSGLHHQFADRQSVLDGAPRTPEQPMRAPPPGGPVPDQPQSPSTRIVCRVGRSGRSYHRQGSPCTKGKEVETLTETKAQGFLSPCGQPCCKSLAFKKV
jgi:hypothetical protein